MRRSLSYFSRLAQRANQAHVAIEPSVSVWQQQGAPTPVRAARSSPRTPAIAAATAPSAAALDGASSPVTFSPGVGNHTVASQVTSTSPHVVERSAAGATAATTAPHVANSLPEPNTHFSANTTSVSAPTLAFTAPPSEPEAPLATPQARHVQTETHATPGVSVTEQRAPNARHHERAMGEVRANPRAESALGALGDAVAAAFSWVSDNPETRASSSTRAHARGHTSTAAEVGPQPPQLQPSSVSTNPPASARSVHVGSVQIELVTAPVAPAAQPVRVVEVPPAPALSRGFSSTLGLRQG